jgi:hypothetical protein
VRDGESCHQIKYSSNKVNVTKKSFQYGEHEVTIETGGIARQADGAVMVDIAETAVLVTAVGRKTADPGRARVARAKKRY